MATRPEDENEQPDPTAPPPPPQRARVETRARAAATAAQATQGGARNNGIDQQEEPSEVRNLSDDEEARARAEEAMRQMMARPQSKRRGR
jgi:hypothetical protein